LDALGVFLWRAEEDVRLRWREAALTAQISFDDPH
jgi:hypothetical protein